MGKDKKEKKRKHRDDDEEDRARKAEKLAKKVAKHLKKHHTAGGGAYSNEDNPFGDANLSERFVWGKKIERQLASGVDVRELTAKAEKERQAERLAQLERVKQRRLEREAEKAQQEEELNQLQRDRALAEAVELDRKEEQFHLEQARMRAAQRIREGRAKPIDLVAKNLHLADDFDPEIEEPYTIFDGLVLSEIRDLQEDIDTYQELDVLDPVHVEFWEAMRVVCEAELAEAQRQDAVDRSHMRGGAAPGPSSAGAELSGLPSSIDVDVQASLAGKTHAQLSELEETVTAQLASGETPDPEYWTAVLQRLAVHKARARLREIHASLLKQHVERLIAEEAAAEGAIDVPAAMGWDREAGGPDVKPVDSDNEGARDGAAAPSEHVPKPEEPEPGTDEDEFDELDVAQFSPPRLDPREAGGADVVPEEDDLRLLELLRAQVKYRQASAFRAAGAVMAAANKASEADRAYQAMISDPSRAPGGVHPMLRYIADAAPQKGEPSLRSGSLGAAEADPDTRRLQAAAARSMGDAAAAGDAPFGGEVALEAQVYWWHDKYRPRRPKYFNRVHTGYEWNKYNQTHYDHDNPPPKVVQGYKFNIFYPDLIDKTESPTYSLERDPAEDEQGSTCLLRFHAGPPYEDIAFRIVNKEWEYSHKKGFKSTFERGILHLYFNFKRQRYRR